MVFEKDVFFDEENEAGVEFVDIEFEYNQGKLDLVSWQALNHNKNPIELKETEYEEIYNFIKRWLETEDVAEYEEECLTSSSLGQEDYYYDLSREDGV